MEYQGTSICVRSNTKTAKRIPLLLTFVTIFFSTDTLLFGTNSLSTARWFPYFLYVLIALIMAFKVISKRALFAKDYKFYFLIIIAQFFTLIANDDNFVMTCFRVALITAALMITLNYSFHDYVCAFEKVVFFLACYSLVVYLLCYIFPGLIRSFPIVTNMSGYESYVVGPCIVPAMTLGNEIIKNCGIFREPGVYQIYLIIALCIHLFYFDKLDIKKAIILILTVLTSLSTAGLFCVTLCILIYFASKSKGKSEKHFRILLLLILLLCVAFVALAFPQTVGSGISLLFDKLDADSGAYGSPVARLSSFTSNIEVWKTAPLFGVGLNKTDALFDYYARIQYMDYYSVNVTGTHNTNTYLYQLATYGIFFWVLFTVGLFNLSKRITANKNNLIVTILVFALFLFTYANENLYYSILPLVLMFYGLNRNNQPKKSRYIGKNII